MASFLGAKWQTYGRRSSRATQALHTTVLPTATSMTSIKAGLIAYALASVCVCWCASGLCRIWSWQWWQAYVYGDGDGCQIDFGDWIFLCCFVCVTFCFKFLARMVQGDAQSISHRWHPLICYLTHLPDKASTSNVKPTSIRMVGVIPVADIAVQPSDHDGLLARFQMGGATAWSDCRICLYCLCRKTFQHWESVYVAVAW